MSNTVLDLKNVAKTYGHGAAAISVLRAVNLSVRAGEMVALVAPSGAGKSTLLHIAGLLDQPSAGDITVAGVQMDQASDRKRTLMRRQGIGFIYQFHHLLPEFSALENVVLPQLANGVSKSVAHARAQLLLTQVGLQGRMTHRPSDLSGGEQQRVAFCRAMANAPKLLLADEPTGNLDPQTSDVVFEVLGNLIKQSGQMGALIATHNLELAARMDRVVRLQGGDLVDV